VENGGLRTVLSSPRTTQLKHAVSVLELSRSTEIFCTSQACNFAQNVITRLPYYSNRTVGTLFLEETEKMVYPITAPDFKPKSKYRDS
jgi:hypothetical protein